MKTPDPAAAFEAFVSDLKKRENEKKSEKFYFG